MGKSPFSSWSFTQEREKRGCRERSSDFSLRSMELGWLSRVGPRFKVGVLFEGNTRKPKPEFVVRDSSGKFRRPWFRAFESSKSFVFAPRGREPSYSGLFSI